VFEALGDLSTAALGACDEPTDAVDKSVSMLRGSPRESIGVEDHELVHCQLPVVRGDPSRP